MDVALEFFLSFFSLDGLNNAQLFVCLTLALQSMQSVHCQYEIINKPTYNISNNWKNIEISEAMHVVPHLARIILNLNFI